MENQTSNNLGDKATWMRLLYIALFTLAFNIAEFLIAIMVVVQFFTVLFTKKPNERLQNLGGDIGAYLHDVVCFLTFQSDHMPYPVSDWVSKPAATPKPAPTPKRKPPAKKKPLEDAS